MKFFAPSLMGSGLGLILLTATPSFASLTGNLYLGGTGTVTVTATSITFNENNTTPSGSSTAVGVGTTIPGVSAGDPVDINGGSTISEIGGLPTAVTFPDDPGVSATITSFGPGSTNTDCAGLTTGESCSAALPGGTSPIILTYTGPGTESATGGTGGNEGTDAVLPTLGTLSDGGSTAALSGSFSATIPDETPESLVALFSSSTGASFSTTYSGSFTATSTSSTVPEPRTTSLMAVAGLLMGLAFYRRRKQVQQ
jgi:hypothetical protein